MPANNRHTATTRIIQFLTSAGEIEWAKVNVAMYRDEGSEPAWSLAAACENRMGEGGIPLFLGWASINWDAVVAAIDSNAKQAD